MYISLSAQNFRGKVTNEAGEALPYAAIYIRELSSGFVTDDTGFFHTTLPAGSYTCEVSSLGYTKQVVAVQIPPEGLVRDIIMPEQVYQLHEVRITRDNEDPAYSVMRNAIANAPKHRYQVATYTADTYLKGSGKLMDVPGIMMLSKEFREMVGKYMNRTFLLEEQRKVTYTAPNNWDNEVIAYTNSFPENIMISLQTTDINLYTPEIFGKVSPLSAGAFSFYDFKLDGCYSEGDYLINKVRVIPKKNNPQLVSGHLYIVEELWCLSGLDLGITDTGLNAGITVTCNEVQPSLFLSTSISLKASMSMLGLKAEAAYLSSIKYQKVEKAELNQLFTSTAAEISQPSVISKLTPKQEKTIEKIQELTAKEDLSTREAYKLSKLMAKSIQLSDTTRSKYKYERKLRNYQEKTDSLATLRDSLYWTKVRSIPLSEEELASYEYKKELTGDSVQGKKKKGFGNELLQILLVGKTYQTKNKKAWITLKDLPSYVPEYNFVDGLWVGATLETGLKLSETTTMKFIPEAYYTTARKEWIGKGTLTLDYAPRNLGRFWLTGGIASSDFNTETGESRMINSYSSLLFGRNDIRMFERKYLTVGNQVEIINSMLFTSILDWERRNTLDNHVNKSLFGKKAKPNIPGNDGYIPMPENDVLKATVSLSYTPAHYYRMIYGRKIYENSSWPTFSILYQQAFAHGGADKLTPSFKRFEFSMEQTIKFGMFNNLYWYVNGGTLWDKKDVQFADFRHFSATRLPVTERAFNQGFTMLGNYSLSTDSRWAQANVMWSTPYLLIKHLPFLQRKHFDEALHLRTLFVKDRDAYSEVGYSIGLLDMGRVGVFVSFDKLDYRSTGVSVSLPIMKILGE